MTYDRELDGVHNMGIYRNTDITYLQTDGVKRKTFQGILENWHTVTGNISLLVIITAGVGSIQNSI